MRFPRGLRRVSQLTILPRIWFFYLVGLSIAVLRRLLWITRGTPVEHTEEILYVAKNRLSVLYILENARLLSTRGNAKCAVTAPPWLRPEIERRASEAKLCIRFTPLRRAILAKWKLIIYTHHYLGFCFDRTSPSVYVSHGIETGKKTLYDTLYTYGFKGMRTPREPVYHAMIATHAAELDLACREYPSYRAVVTTSTDAVLERLMLRAAQKNSLKTRLGISDNRPVALFMSTWGHPSLMSSHGAELAGEAGVLSKDFQLIFSVHPKLIASRRTRSVLRTLQAKGAKVIPPAVSWVDYMAVADVAVSDITSMCLYSALLGIPLVFLGCSLDRLIPGGLVDEVVRHSAHAGSARDLRTRLWDALDRPNRDVATRIRNQFPHLGDAAHLIGTINSLASAQTSAAAALHRDTTDGPRQDAHRSMRPGPTKRLAVTLLGPAVAIAALLLVFAKVPLSLVRDALQQAQLGWVGAALAVSLVVQLVDAARLRRLTDMHRLGLSLWDVFKMNVASQFYGLVLPGGSLSGIAIRCSQLPTHERKVGVGISFLVDQAVATAAMCAVGIVFWLGDHAASGLITGATIITVLCGAMLLLTAVLAPARIAAILPIRWLITRLGDRVQSVRDAVRPFSRLDRRTLLQISTLAVASNLLRIMVYFLLAQALGLGVALVTIGWIRSVMMIATMPPVSVSGLGLREGISLVLLSTYGIAAERIVAFSLSVFTVSTLFGLLGGVFEVGRFGRALLAAVGRMQERKAAARLPIPALVGGSARDS